MTTDLLGDVLELLKRTQALLASPDTWCKHVLALDEAGQPVAPDDPRARRFCVGGAVLRAEWELHGTTLNRTSAAPKAPFEGAELWAQAPPRLLAAVGALAYPLCLAWQHLYGGAVVDEPGSEPANQFDDPMEMWREIASAVTAEVNDEDGIGWGHVRAALKFAVGVMEDELARRHKTGAV